MPLLYLPMDGRREIKYLSRNNRQKVNLYGFGKFDLHDQCTFEIFYLYDPDFPKLTSTFHWPTSEENELT
ncbi:hypothetical protein TNIN_20791 [Trichonephila inaurata madagascariensis]|uniref:Uncharacterized protein n=1 Tax=Trichonephila inaurata madagascariensis TaxID=2747483 RepID=A0A8X6YG66_9ARAC|nr:hypothetical protein TNIN_20791 [Trichonephila inaurata madagascariensis]